MIYEEKESYAVSRAGGIGGTDAAAICGLSPWKRPIDIYAGKVYPQKQPELDKECLQWGLALEPLVRERYAAKFSATVAAPSNLSQYFAKTRPWNDSTLIVGPEDWMLGAPDGWQPDSNAGLEVKCSSRKGHEWGVEGSDEVPAHYLVQVAWYMAVTAAKAWDFAVLFSGNTLTRYHVEVDPELQSELIETCRAFWNDNILARVEPDIDESESYGKYLARKFSLPTGTTLRTPTDGILSAVDALREADAALKAAEDAKQLAKNQLAAALGDANADAAITPWGKCGWVRPGARSTVDWKAVAADLGIPQDVIDEHTKETPVSAYVRLWAKG